MLLFTFCALKFGLKLKRFNYVHILSFLCYCTVQCIHNFHCCTQPGVLTWTIFRCNDEGSMNSRTHIEMFCGGITKLQLGQRYEEILWRKPFRNFLSLSLLTAPANERVMCHIIIPHNFQQDPILIYLDLGCVYLQELLVLLLCINREQICHWGHVGWLWLWCGCSCECFAK
jgi:hypothetical protein